MKIHSRADLLATISRLCERYPNWRLGQLVANVAGWADRDIWDVEDDQLYEAAQQHLAQCGPSEAASVSLTAAAETASRRSGQ